MMQAAWRARFTRVLVLVLGLASAPGCWAPPASFLASHLAGRERLHGDGHPTSFKVVIVGDGFTDDAASMGAYRTAAHKFANQLVGVQPFAAMQDAIDIYRVDVISDEPGIDVPEACGTYLYAAPPASLTDRARTPRRSNTALGTTWCPDLNNLADYRHIVAVNDQRVIDETRVVTFALQAGVVPNLIVVLVNDWMWGASAWPVNSSVVPGYGGVAYASIEQNLIGDINPITKVLLQPKAMPGFPKIAVHESGHLGPFLLNDEYGYVALPGPLDPAYPALMASVNDSPNLFWSGPQPPPPPLKWAHLTSGGDPVWTDCVLPSNQQAGDVPDGAYYLVAADGTGPYHPRCECRMNSYASPTFCVVCRERVLDRLTPHTPPTFGLRVMVDSLRLNGLGGDYFLDYKFSVGGATYTGRWPSPTLPKFITSGVITEPGTVFFELPPSAVLPSTLNVAVTLVRVPPGPLSLPRTVTLTIPASGTGVVQRFGPSGSRGGSNYSLTLAMVRR